MEVTMTSDLSMHISGANTVWVLLSAALVMFMTVPALGMFYGGLVKKKNVLNIMMQSFASLGIVSLIWVTVGYSLAFSPTELIPGILGDFKWAMLSGISPSDPSPYFVSDASGRVPHLAFVMFQCMFAVITPAVISGATAERMKFPAFVLFVVLWTFAVYIPLTHMMWSSGGLLAKAGLADFAGGTVVEINSGFSALAAALFLGRRRNLRGTPPHDLTYTLAGAAMLWFGWFGFNAGSTLAADGLAAMAFLNTNMAAAAAACVWASLDWIVQKKPTILGFATGGVAGLVVITPACGFVSLGGALLLGLLAGSVCYLMVVVVKNVLRYDDSLDAFGVHGVAGLIGILGTGLLADPAVTRGFAMNGGRGIAGLAFGNAHLFKVQSLAAALTMTVSFAGSLIILKIVDLLVGVRVSEKEEAMGLDVTQHNERAYTIIE
jgi:Amt family ammonium transporter